MRRFPNFTALFLVSLFALGSLVSFSLAIETYESKIYGFKATVPDGWKVINMDDEEEEGSFQPVFEMKRKKALKKKKPKLTLQAMKQKIEDIEKFGRDFVAEIQKGGFRIKKEQVININGKPAFEATGEMRVGSITVINTWVFMAGKKHLFMITLSEADLPEFEEEINQLFDSIEYN
jgi:hypothetical protein